MISSILRLVIFALVTAFCVFFAVNNQGPVVMVWSPLHDSYELPAFIMGLGGVGIGFLIGVFLGWLNLFPKKLEIYRLKKQVGKLEKQLEIYVEEEDQNAAETTEIETNKANDERLADFTKT